MRAKFVIHNHRAYAFILELTPDHDSRNAALLQVREHIDVDEQPVGQYNQRLDTAIQKHFKVPLEAAAFVVNVGQDR